MDDGIIKNIISEINKNKYKKIVVVGYPNSGKTKIAVDLASALKLEIINTDDFMNRYKWEDQPDKIIEKLSKKNGYVVEGIQCYRGLRTGEENRTYKPDIIINVISQQPTQKEHIGMIKTLHKIWRDYCNMIKGKDDVKIRTIVNFFFKDGKEVEEIPIESEDEDSNFFIM